jgi:hypothetical protein
MTEAGGTTSSCTPIKHRMNKKIVGGKTIMNVNQTQKANATSLKMLIKQSCVWVDPKAKVASFHELTGGMPMQFGDEEIFLAFLDGLINNHYKFQ